MTKIIRLLCLVFLAAGCRPAPAGADLPAVTTQPEATLITRQPDPTSSPTAVEKDPPLLMAHYMPWYQTPAVSGSWGWHWTMNHYNPNQPDADGRPMIASHYTPLTGPYDSSDEKVLEYQVLLMKISGIDGVIIDWFGYEDFRDYGLLHEGARRMIEMIEKAGLRFAISYEDQSVKHMITEARLEDGDAYEYGQKVMAYLEQTWFGREAYLKGPGERPVLLVFGPQYFASANDWETLFAGLELRPLLITLDRHYSPSAAGSFPWPPMWASQDGVLSQGALENYLAGFYEKGAGWEYRVGGAFPGFHDIYEQAGVGTSYGFLDAVEGETFRITLQAALDSRPDLVQLITWNDYGEGTLIEPTQETGYQYLEIVQGAKRGFAQDDFGYSAEDLHLPLRLYQLRVKHSGDAAVNAALDQAFTAILAGDIQAAEEILNQYPDP